MQTRKLATVNLRATSHIPPQRKQAFLDPASDRGSRMLLDLYVPHVRPNSGHSAHLCRDPLVLLRGRNNRRVQSYRQHEAVVVQVLLAQSYRQHEAVVVQVAAAARPWSGSPEQLHLNPDRMRTISTANRDALLERDKAPFSNLGPRYRRMSGTPSIFHIAPTTMLFSPTLGHAHRKT